jgi:hypothetical protein
MNGPAPLSLPLFMNDVVVAEEEEEEAGGVSA